MVFKTLTAFIQTDVNDGAGSWSFSNDEQTITLFGGANFEVNEITATSFVFTLNTSVDGNPIYIVYSYDRTLEDY